MADTWERSGCLRGHTDSVTCVGFDAHCIISGSEDKTVRVWDSLSQLLIITLTGMHSHSVVLAFRRV